MKVQFLYRPNSEHERKVLDFQRDFNRRTGHDIELISLDTREGSSIARTYDVTRYPALMVLDDGGGLQKLWQDEHMPLINEVSFYTSGPGATSI